jgi:hypothetical protein
MVKLNTRKLRETLQIIIENRVVKSVWLLQLQAINRIWSHRYHISAQDIL